ncbi:MAG: SDR family NAD(P)-dependent oxidoreductase, partial [Syntrophales bacterium]|nr:SDR family NAD(P)-dependent oxidoreductase [Syntrophales bacterium]
MRDKIAIVTGGARGIGQACAIALAKEGAHVCVTDIIPMDETLHAIKSFERQALGIKTDVSQKEDVLNMVAQVIEKFGKIDILVNNAGTCQRVPLEELTEEQWDRDVNTIMKGTFLCTQAVYPHMKKNGSGKIVNIASISGKIGGAVSKKGAGAEGKRGRSGPAYAAAKGGVIAFTKWVAKDAGCYGIYVNAIAPGGIETDMSKGFVYPIEDLPIARMGKPQDVAQMVVFLA